VYAHARDSELRAHPWNFARARAQLAADATAPAFGYLKQYPLPSDCLRILPNDNTGVISTQDDWQIEGRKILTNDSSPIYLVYIKQVTDESEFDALFIELLVSRIALDMVEAITQSNKKKEAASTRYVLAQRDARKANAFARAPQEPPTDPWVSARL
tara:strand:+ start:4739 stop:5209 length:471 start_codon:yes stop_codon:yes gene_type:complete